MRAEHSGCQQRQQSAAQSFGDRLRGERVRKFPPACPSSASPPESSNSQDSSGRSAAITRRASARSGVTSAARFARDAAPRASRPRSPALPSRDCRGSTTARLVMPPKSSCDIRLGPAGRCHRAVAFEGRIASDTSTSRPCGAGVAQDISTSSRVDAESIASSACIANCGWFDAGRRGELCSCAFRDAADRSPRRSSSRSVSSPGSTTAPGGRFAISVREASRSPASSRSSPPRSPDRL